MKRFIYLCLAIGMIAAQQPAVAQATQTIAKPLKLTSVPLGTGTEKILVRDTTGMVRQVDKTTLTPRPTTPTLQQVINAGDAIVVPTATGSYVNKIGYNSYELYDTSDYGKIKIEAFMHPHGINLITEDNYGRDKQEFYLASTYFKFMRGSLGNISLEVEPLFNTNDYISNTNIKIPAINGNLLAIGQENTIPTVAGGVSYVMEGEIPYVLIKTPTRIIKIKAEIPQPQ